MDIFYIDIIYMSFKPETRAQYYALTSVAQLVGCCPAKKKVTSLIPSPGACLAGGVQSPDGVRTRGD